MGRIVVGVDGSAGAGRAVEWAAAETRLRSADLVLVHAWHVPTSVTMASAAMPVVHWELLEQAARQILDGAVEQARSLGAEAEPSLVQHYPAPALIGLARGAELLVVGSRGRGGFAGLLLGSVSQEVAHHAPCPVVIVPGKPD